MDHRPQRRASGPASLRFPHGGVFAVTRPGDRAGLAPPTPHDDEREILASLQGLRAEVDELGDMIERALAFPGPGDPPDPPAAA